MGRVLPSGAGEVVKQQLTCTVVDMELARALSERSQKMDTLTKVHVKVDTGLNRFGVSLREAPALIQNIGVLPSIKVTGLYTHFSSADESDETPTRLQLERLLKLAACFPEIGLVMPPIVLLLCDFQKRTSVWFG